MVNRARRWIVTPPSVNAAGDHVDLREGHLLLGAREVEGFQLEDNVGSLNPRRTASWRKIEIPIAVISGARRGALRRGR